MIRQALARFMSGRYGGDQLNTAMMVTYLVLYLVAVFTRWYLLEIIALVLLVISLFRMLSRKHDRRRAENAKFLQLTRPLARRAKNLKTRVKDREHRYFKCPGCGQQMRVPRGKGRITVHCRTCGANFEEKS